MSNQGTKTAQRQTALLNMKNEQYRNEIKRLNYELAKAQHKLVAIHSGNIFQAFIKLLKFRRE